MSGAKPWDLFNPNTEYVSQEEFDKRYAICNKCPLFFNATKQCRQCGCFMNIKAKMSHATCPVGKW